MKRKDRDKDIIETASSLALNKNDSIEELLNKHKLSSDFVHAIIAMDVNRVQAVFEQLKDDFNPNMTDLSYCFSWFKPSYRNLPKFILEVGIETECEPIVELLLTHGCNVNFLNSKTGNPLYYFAFVKKYSRFKSALLKNANYNIKNYRGQSVLFYLIYLYIHINFEDDQNTAAATDAQIILEHFRDIISKNTMLLTHRDQDCQTLTEMIITLEPNYYKKALAFLKEISDFLLNALSEKNLKIIQKMIYHSYGLVLMSSCIFPKDADITSLTVKNSVTLDEYILDNNLFEFIHNSKSFENDFLYKIYEFNAAIRYGDENSVRKHINENGDKFLIATRDYSGRSCLHLAVLFSQPVIVT